MYGEPKDVEGECNAHLYIGDNYGDGHATMRCQLPDGHDGPHRERYSHRGLDGEPGPVEITWEKDDRCWHEWIELATDEGKETFLKIGGDDGEKDLSWVGEYEHRVEDGDRYVCKGCQVTVREPTKAPFA